MANRALTREFYDRLVEVFRAQGENAPSYRGAAKAAKVGRELAWKAWNTGWPEHPQHSGWALPIKGVLEQDRRLARERLLQEERASREAVRKAAQEDAANQIAEEVKLVRNVRNTATGVLGIMAVAFPAARAAAEQLVIDVGAGALKGDPLKALKVVGSFLLATARVAAVAETAQTMERRRLGKPNEVFGLEGIGDSGPQSLESLERELRAAENALVRARELGVQFDTDSAETPEAVSVKH